MTVIYVKDSEAISNFLILIGSNRGTLAFEQTRVIKEYRNNMNRKINCEVANMDKIAVAASRQLNDILLLKKMKKFEELPEDWTCPLCGAGKEDFEPDNEGKSIYDTPDEF